MKIVNKIFQICSTLFHLESLVISCLCDFFKSLFTKSTFLDEIFSELFLLIKWVYNPINLRLSFFDSFLEFDENLFFFLIKTEIDVDKFIFFYQLLSCFDVFFLHLRYINFGVFEKKVLEDEFLFFLLLLLALKLWNGLVCIHDNKLKLLYSILENMNLLFYCRIFTHKLSICRGNNLKLLIKRLQLFL